MKKYLFLFLILLFPVVFCGCNYLTTNNINNADIVNKTTNNLYFQICEDMNNVATTLRALDVLYYEDYAITELSPLVGYSTYQNQTNNFGIAANNNNITNEVPVSAINLTNISLEYNYKPKYILDTTTLDTSFLLSYIQSLQDLFLITNDITAGNEILSNLIYNTINEALNIKNNAGLTNIANLNLTVEQNYIFSECSIGIHSLLSSIINSSGFIDTELDSIITLRNNYYKNIEALNIKYITILNIIDNRIVQIQNLQQLLQRLNNQLLILSNNSLTYNNNIVNNNLSYNQNYSNYGINNNYNELNNPNFSNTNNYTAANNNNILDNNNYIESRDNTTNQTLLDDNYEINYKNYSSTNNVENIVNDNI